MHPEDSAQGKAAAMSGGESDALSAFSTESGLPAQGGPAHGKAAVHAALESALRPKGQPPSASAPLKPAGPRVRVRWPASASAFAAVLLAIAGLFWGYQQLIPVDAAASRPATLNVVTEPAGVDVLINGELRGVSPLSLSLAAGNQTLTLRQGAEERVVPLALVAGAEVTHHIEFAAPAAAVPVVGALSVVTDPPGAQVEIDGRPRGVSPLSLKDLTTADHKVRVSGATGSAERTVTVVAGTTASVMFALPKVSSPSAGWITIAAPFDVSVSEAGNVVGTGRTAKIMLPAGRHTLSLTNDALQYESERLVDVAAGQTAAVRVDPPKASLSANARPWADVTVDGASVGQTPIANLPLAIGTHDVLFRHPQLGERRQTIVVTARGPNRVAVDLTK
jgi:hypothetical protein